MKIEKGEIRKPKSSEEKSLEVLQQDIKNQSGDQKLLIKHLNDLLPSLQHAFENLPKEVLNAFATKLEFSLKQTVQLEDGSKVEITNLNTLAEAVKTLSNEFNAWKAKDTVTIKNIEKIKPDMVEINKTLDSFAAIVNRFIEKEVNVIVNNPDEVHIKNWPKKPSEAIPVVLVDKDLKKFYNSIASFIGGGGGSFTQTPIKYKVGNTDQFVDADHPLPIDDAILNGKIPDQSGVWGYAAGTNGEVILSGGKRVLQITAIALGAAGSFTINAGNTIIIPYNTTDKASSSIAIEPKANLTDPTIVFDAGVDSYFIEYVV